GFRCHPTGGDNRGFSAFQRGNLFLSRGDRGIAITGIEIQLSIALSVSPQTVHAGHDEDRSLRDGRGQRRSLTVTLFSRVNTASGVGAVVSRLLHGRSLLR